MNSKTYTLPIRAVDRDTFLLIKNGKKKVETRAGGKKYKDIRAGDTVVFSCGKSRFTRTVRTVHVFRTVAAMLRKYKVKDINPTVTTNKELIAMYRRFPGYRLRIKKYGLIVFTLQ